MELLLFAALSLFGVGGLSWALVRDDSWVKRSTAATVVVHTRDNRSIRGVLIEATRYELVLRRATYLQEGVGTELDGEIGVQRDNVAFIQNVSPAQ